MTKSFDLVDRPWIPVVAGGEPGLVGLRELFVRAAEFDDVVLPVPPAASGLWRILYAITARVTGLDAVGGARWRQRQEQVLDRGAFVASDVDAYFARCRGRFDLFDPVRPWMQDPRLAGECPKSSGVNKLVFDRPAGNTQVWFGHHTDAGAVAVAAGEAAWYLIAQLYYGASGRCISREVGGQKFANSNAGPLRGAMSYHPLGENLFESLVVGVPPRMSGQDEGPDLCPWERDELPDPLGVPWSASWPCGALTGRSRHAVLLVPDATGEAVTDAYVTWAWRLPSPEQVDPYVVRRQNKEGGWYQLPADGSRALWRDVDALLGGNTEVTTHRPDIMIAAVDLELGGRVRAYGFDQDRQAKDRQWFTAVTPPVLGWLRERDPVTADGVALLTRSAEKTGRRMGTALRQAWRDVANVKDRDGPWARVGEAYYWARAEAVFWECVREGRFTEGVRAFARLGHEAIDYAADGEASPPRMVRAVQTAHRLLSAPTLAKKGSTP
ncbi:type I-E CRISPR-associated protein Cse1/CasA [Micromonospora sp. HUAS LYJ1]|uniref:type I-E CRISPR-associated protein Cse1/CasA n=1 Tax=Micromonospora sp. HUAS LYJ1 TaxID=3061626 RepID=UPI002672EE02|nr:type I-E CRISPR-associated protein Cse1/CasA [Micromonospora sp. HUAS LYJ1]WKU03498.1 type I-E CRISPR-associated protein Cse1/CasA [Micromonospora sp. HUAS LYJ1]